MNADERRQFPRFETELEAQVSILAPDETFTPESYRGRIVDISRGGLKVQLSPIDRNQFNFLIRGPRFLKLLVRLPANTADTLFYGRVIWLDFSDKTTPPVCSVGICFVRTDSRTQTDLERFLHRLEGSPKMETGVSRFAVALHARRPEGRDSL